MKAGTAFRRPHWNFCAREHLIAADYLGRLPFVLCHGTNHFGDEFHVLVAVVGPAKYSDVEDDVARDPDVQLAFRQMATAISDVGYYVRFVSLEVALTAGATNLEEATTQPPTMKVAVERTSIVKDAVAWAEAKASIEEAIEALSGIESAGLERDLADVVIGQLQHVSALLDL